MVLGIDHAAAASANEGVALVLRGPKCDWGVVFDEFRSDEPWVVVRRGEDRALDVELARRSTFELAATVLAAQASRIGPATARSDLDAGRVDGVVVLAIEVGTMEVVAHDPEGTFVGLRQVDGEWTASGASDDLGDAVLQLAVDDRGDM